MPTIIEQIQNDILQPTISMSNILLKAKVLAYELKNASLKNWIRNELDGYPNKEMLPDYRIISVNSSGKFVSFGIGSLLQFRDLPIPVSVLPNSLQREVSSVRLREGIRSLEEMAQSEHGVSWEWPAEWIGVFNDEYLKLGSNLQCIKATISLSPYIFSQIVETVRSRLQDLILELTDSPWYIENASIEPEYVQHLVEVNIFKNEIIEGDKITGHVTGSSNIVIGKDDTMTF